MLYTVTNVTKTVSQIATHAAQRYKVSDSKLWKSFIIRPASNAKVVRNPYEVRNSLAINRNGFCALIVISWCSTRLAKLVKVWSKWRTRKVKSYMWKQWVINTTWIVSSVRIVHWCSQILLMVSPVTLSKENCCAEDATWSVLQQNGKLSEF